VHHEQAGAFAAEAYARINGKLGVAMATSGPGALNMLTGIGSCFFDSVPCLFITGQVNTYEYKFDRSVRQIGFQETDIVSVAKPLTKYSEMVVNADNIRYCLEKAVFLARNGRPGPVLLDVPMNIQRSQIEPGKLESFYDSEEFLELQKLPELDSVQVDEVLQLMVEAQRPVILVGGGVRTAMATQELQSLVEKTGIPVVTSLMGLDAIPHDNHAFFGMIGSYGNRYSNLTLANSDFLLILGSRLDSRQTGTRPDTFARAAKRVHVDIDPDELNARVNVYLPIQYNAKDFLVVLNNNLARYAKPDLSNWYRVIEGYRKKYPTTSEHTESQNINPNRFMEKLSYCCAKGDIVCLDVGQNQMWAAQSFNVKEGQRILISGGMGAMGFALPAAIGATLAAPGKRTIVISGDGGIQINMQELDTIANHKLPIKIFILNNGCLGMVRQFQDMYFGGRQQSTVIGYGCPDLVKVAEAYGIPSFTIKTLAGAEETILKVINLDGPVFVDVKLQQTTCVDPKLMVNHPIEDMSPVLDREALKKEMLIDLADKLEGHK
jgi:acetolactate synthase I/II/III large subunit